MRNALQKIGTGLLLAGVLALSGCGGSEDAVTSDIGSVAKDTTGSTSCNSACPEKSTGWYSHMKSKYAGDTQCLSQVQAAESYRQSAIANCAAGSTTGATGNCSYYKQSVSYLTSFCPY